MVDVMNAPKRVEVADDINADARLSVLIGPAREILKDEVGKSFDSLSESWRLVRQEPGRPLVMLRIKGPWGAEAETGFTPAELQNPSVVGRRMNRLWGDALAASTKVLLERLNGKGASEEGE
jgi:hypothetical protein